MSKVVQAERECRRVVAASYLLGMVAYGVPWLRLRVLKTGGLEALVPCAIVFACGLLFATWTSRSRHPILVSAFGAWLTVLGVLGAGKVFAHTTPDLHHGFLATVRSVSTRADGITLAVALVVGVLFAVPAVWAEAAMERPSLDSADRLLAKSGTWMFTLALAPLGQMFRTWSLGAHDFSTVALVAVEAAIALFAIVVNFAGLLRMRRRRAWLSRVRRGEVPGFRLRPRLPSDPDLLPYDSVTALACDAVLEVCESDAARSWPPSPAARRRPSGRPVAFAALRA